MKINATGLTRPVARGVLILRKHGPTLAFSTGVVGVVTSTVMACRATLKLSEELPEMKYKLEQVKEMNHTDETERGKDLAYIYAQNTMTVAKLYAPAVIIGAASITALTGSHITLNRRNAGLTAGYAAVSAAYDEYRERVKAELGDDRESDIYRGLTHKKVKVDGSDKKVSVAVFDPNKRSPYARIFDATSSEWQKNAELNRMFVQCQQNYMNHRLQSMGHVFLNEVYDALGFERTPAGSQVGWVISDEGDNHIDFCMFEAYNRDFINGIERSILLDFNVDGVIWDKI